jgi:hypothetical protein
VTDSTFTLLDMPRPALVQAAYREAFAGPEETLVTVLAPDDSLSLRSILAAASPARGGGESPLRLVVFGRVPAEPPRPSHPGLFGLHFLEGWARPILPGLLSVSDGILVLGQELMPLEEVLEASDPGTLVYLDQTLQGVVPHSSQVKRFQALDAEGTRRILEDLGAHRGLPSARKSLPPTRPSRPARLLELEETPLPAPLAPMTPPPSRRDTKTRHFILQNDWGIGDELLLSAVAREILRAWPEVKLWIRSRFGFRFPSYVRTDPPPPDAQIVETIYQNAGLYGPAHHSPFPGTLVQQMLDKFFLDTGLRVTAHDIRPELAPPPNDPIPRDPGTVILHSRPNPRLPSKDWGLPRWQALIEILSARGLKIRQVGGHEEPLLPQAEDHRGLPMGPLQELVLESSVVVSVVGFLMHLAQATRTPAVVIYGGRENPAIDGYPDQIALGSGALPCRGRWGCHLAPDTPCTEGMKCMDEITPELVAGEIVAVLGEDSAGRGR